MDTWRLDLVRRSKKSKLRGVLAQFKMMCSGFIRKSWIPNASVRRAAAYETSRGELALLGVFVHGSFLCVLAPNVDLAKLIEVDAQKEVKEKVKEKKKEKNPIPTVFQFNAETSASAARIDTLKPIQHFIPGITTSNKRIALDATFSEPPDLALPSPPRPLAQRKNVPEDHQKIDRKSNIWT